MPHLTLEYTANLNVDVQPLLARLHSELVATGVINLKGLKSRAVRHDDYRIADGNPEYAFVHVNLLIRAGRPLEVQRELAEGVMAVLKGTFGDRFENGHLSLSVDVKEMREGVALTFHNIPDLGAVAAAAGPVTEAGPPMSTCEGRGALHAMLAAHAPRWRRQLPRARRRSRGCAPAASGL